MLNEFLVLGQVPGTNFQITFNEFLMLLDISVLAYFVWRNHWIEAVKYQFLYWRLYIKVRKSQLLAFRHYRLSIKV